MLWIRIQILIGSGSRRVKMTHKNRKKLINFIFRSAGCSLLRAEGFSCSLDISKLQFLIKKERKKNFCCNFFFGFWSLKSWIRIRSGSISGFTWNARSGSTALLIRQSVHVSLGSESLYMRIQIRAFCWIWMRIQIQVGTTDKWEMFCSN